MRRVDERHEVLVPCDFSPTGRHRVWVFQEVEPGREDVWGTNEREVEIVYLASECGDEGDAAGRLGATSCVAVVAEVRGMIDGGKSPRRIPMTTVKIPFGLQDIVRHVAARGTRKRKAREAPKVDSRPLLSRLLTKRLRAVSGLPFTVDLREDGTRQIGIGTPYGGYSHASTVSVLASRRPGGPWSWSGSTVRSVAPSVGFEHSSKLCLVCRNDPKLGAKQWDDFRAHARGGPHCDNFAKLLQRSLWALPRGYRDYPDSPENEAS